MYLAKTASLVSSDLSRQVGAAIVSKTGEMVSLGSNEVPKAGGGSYWTDDPSDARDFQVGIDQNQITKSEVFGDFINRMFEDGHLSTDLLELRSTQSIVNKLFSGKNAERYKKSRVMDIIEFGRMIHAEMSAICDAARTGTSVLDGTMYVTTFPCHICAKHIVASGIRKLVYLEPYPKSYADKFHSDSIQVDEKTDQSKVNFSPFMGIAPYRYRDLFEKGKRKNDDGEAKKWKTEPRRPIIEVLIPAYMNVEEYVIAVLGKVVTEPVSDEDETQC
jgi:cytidine deaminase